MLETTLDEHDDPGEAQQQWLVRLRARPGDALRRLRLLGCHEGAWNRADTFDRALLQLAAERGFDATEWPPVLDAARKEERVAVGLAAVFVHDEAGRRLTAEQRVEALPIVARAALRHPQPWNRARMLQRLRDDAGQAATDQKGPVRFVAGASRAARP